MNSRERVEKALNHQQPDRTPVDFGSSAVTGVSASAVHKLRVGLGLHKPGQRVKVIEPYQMLGEVEGDLAEALGVDCVGLGARKNLFGFENKDWKPWELTDGTPVWVPAAFNTTPEPNGDILMYPEGDRRAAPSGRMPAGGFYFDSIVRQPPIDDNHLNVADNLEEFAPVSDDELRDYERESIRLAATGRAIVGSFGGTSFGDIALVPAPWLKNPKGIRDVAEWYMSGLTRKSYIQELFARQAEIALANLERIRQAVGNRVSVIFVSGTDFGTQRAQFISTESYRSLYLPVHKKVNDWVHQHTGWKTFLHSCGAIEPLIPHFIEAGFDILNPVQTTAAGMDARLLKSKYGARVTFWGGGAEAQGVLSFGAPEEVKRQVRERLALFGAGGGFVFNAIHNVQATTPLANLMAMAESLQEARLQAAN
jgi:uroporphyrinogen-III decarboxylase